MREIVGAKIGNIITNNPLQIMDAVIRDREIRFLDRNHMKLMSMADLGIRWDEMATSQTLFLVDDDGKVHANKIKGE